MILEKQKQRLRLEERDYKVLAALEKWGVLGMGQLDGLLFRKGIPPEERVRLLFNEIQRSDYWLGAYKRLRRLENEGYIRLGSCWWVPRYYLLTGKGHQALKAYGKADLFHYRKRLPDGLTRHELQVNAAGLVLAEFLGLKAWTAREWLAHNRFDLRKQRRGSRLILPDLQVLNATRPIAIEVELGQKSVERYWDIWRAYGSSWHENGIVLYLVSWPHGVRLLTGLARKWSHDFVYVAHLDDFKKRQGCCLFYGATGEYFLRQEVKA